MKLFKPTVIFLFLSFIFTTLSLAQEGEIKEKAEVKGVKVEGGMLYGSELNADIQTVALSDLLGKSPDYEGKVVKLEGTIADVCQTMGCWLMLSDGSNELRVTTMHKFFMPKDCAKSKAVVDGTFKVTEISEEHAKKMNEESQNSKIKTEDIKGPQKVYTLEATGVKILSE